MWVAGQRLTPSTSLQTGRTTLTRTHVSPSLPGQVSPREHVPPPRLPPKWLLSSAVRLALRACGVPTRMEGWLMQADTDSPRVCHLTGGAGLREHQPL